MSVRRKHETLPPRLKLKRRYPIEEINIEARKKSRGSYKRRFTVMLKVARLDFFGGIPPKFEH